MSVPLERQKNILTVLEKKDYAEVSYLSQKFNVSEMTIRRDLEKLEKEGELIRVLGGAKLSTKKVYEGTVDERLSTNLTEKRQIASVAVSLIENGDVIAFDASTSALEVSKRLKGFESLTVVTNNISIAVELASEKGITVILLGGYVRGKSLSTIGGSLSQYLQSINIDKCFISSKAISFEEGLTDATIDEGEAKQAMIRKSNQVIVLADHTKLDTVAFFQVCPSNSIQTIITDKPENPTSAETTCIERFQESGTTIYLAD
ncbi:DeoR family transcriptional regulator [Planococcus donghaensis MPA1U2]|uniref:DeoR family transcriptional regulator n=1 Tax=Planococcus donghaensis MPA1U2 TaxID=933115 RepID=E7RDT2_9BACL|nr:DeoR/GlpR family DNA-binding transcription regulator [Planococcus donghaensis]EGA90838.1 DeoR family transcriptional regulator [Planococcus donghaensis MPA1U2]